MHNTVVIFSSNDSFTLKQVIFFKPFLLILVVMWNPLIHCKAGKSVTY